MLAPLLVLVIIAFIPTLLAWGGGYLRNKELGHFDNNNPRQQAAELTGTGARVVAAQSNAWEALALYSASIFAVFAMGVDWSDITLASLVFLAARLMHSVFYICNKATSRSLSYSVGFFSCVYIVAQAF